MAKTTPVFHLYSSLSYKMKYYPLIVSFREDFPQNIITGDMTMLRKCNLNFVSANFETHERHKAFSS